MKAAQDIIIKPIITEESMTGIMMKKYTFKVAKDAGKIEIKKAVRGQKRRQGANVGYTPSWKKAVVTLTEDSKEIEFFNDMM